MDEQALQPAQLVRALALLAALAAPAAAGCSSDEPAAPARTERSATPLEPASRLPPAVRSDRRELVESLGDPRARVRHYRGTRKRALALLDPDAPLAAEEDPVYVATVEGRLRYRRARTPPGEPTTVTGRFAYATYAAGDGSPLDFGVLPTVPRAFR